MTEPDAIPERAGRKPPSSPARGAAVLATQWLAIAWLLLYTLGDLGWQQRLGSWNYLITIAISAVSSQLLEHWRGDGRRTDGRPYRRQQRREARRRRQAEQEAA